MLFVLLSVLVLCIVLLCTCMFCFLGFFGQLSGDNALVKNTCNGHIIGTCETNVNSAIADIFDHMCLHV